MPHAVASCSSDDISNGGIVLCSKWLKHAIKQRTREIKRWKGRQREKNERLLSIYILR